MKAIIIGAGIGGLTTAIALQQQGIDYEIYDAVPECRAVGAGIMLGGNAMTVYERLGVGEAIRNISIFPENIFVSNYKGKVLQKVSNAYIRQRYGQGAHMIHRATLQQKLLQAVTKAVHWGKNFQRLEHHPHGVVAYFEDGSTATADLLIGADGIRSVVREKYVVPAQYRYSGQTCWRAIIPMTLSHDEQMNATEVWGNGNGLRASYMQVDGDLVYFWFTKKMPAGQPFTNSEAIAFMKKELAGFSERMQQIVAAIQPEMLLRADLYDFKPISTWYKDKVVLLGDACHATTPNLGQGASQAIEDALMLARCLKQETTIAAAFKKYQDSRIDRVKKVVGISWQLAQITNWKGILAISLRDRLVRMVPNSITQQQMEFLYSLKW
ncbi:FAD-dependent monooxygenase [Chitinophaga sp. sic0106]|uniref:FAD-dependent monooxygenase n=1 Tax=Chitinophaga sp. sic0106 TaxID=2854785 RepID=UPI001C49534C|nr:FAD-dependent monooxygenase [Chitinophaga sp. sic0106]MBV7532360.1 FAD-dependent monooxygenase [Chitinophaga sp. sic0106]